jgi:hypothetical protein
MKTPLALLLLSSLAMSAEPLPPAHTLCTALVGTCQAAHGGQCAFQLARAERVEVLHQLATLPQAEPTMVVIVTRSDESSWDEDSLRTLAAWLASARTNRPTQP